jgi:hypothetical protein
MLKPVCVPCKRFFQMQKSGFYFIEGIRGPGISPPGTADPISWVPYKIWVADKWKCQGCGAEILSGFGHRPVSEDYKEDFQDKIEQLGASQLQVNDC